MNEPEKIFLASIIAVSLFSTGLAWSDPLTGKVAQSPSYIPAEYQNTISKVLPGYEILRNEDFPQDQNQLNHFLSPDEIAERNKRKSPGYI